MSEATYVVYFQMLICTYRSETMVRYFNIWIVTMKYKVQLNH